MLFPLIVFYIIPISGFVAGIMGLVFGIISDHPFWGMVFTLFFGIFIAFGNGIWMAIQTAYIFLLYPCLNIRNKGDYDKIFNRVADNKRFCMSERIPNIGSQVLKQVRLRAAQDWMYRYNDKLIAIVTTIGPSHNGSVYLADNWKVIGQTAGLPSNRQSVSMKWDDTEGIKEKYVKPTGENKKKIMITERL